MRSEVIGYGWGLLLLSGCQIGMGPPSYIPERALQPVAATTTSPTALKPTVAVPSSNPIPVSLQPVPLASPAADDSQPLPQVSSPVGSGQVVSEILSGSGSSGGASPKMPYFYVQDVILSDSGESVLSAKSEGALTLPYEENKSVQLKVTGSFFPNSNLSEQDMLFTYAYPLITQSFVGTLPAQRVLFDNALLVEVTEITQHTMTLNVNGFGIPDYQQEGSFDLSFHLNGEVQAAAIRLNPQTSNLLPEIQEHEWVLLNDEIVGLKITGKNFMVKPSRNKVMLDDIPYPVSQTQIHQDFTSEIWLDLHGVSIEQTKKHTLSFQNSFGIQVKIIG